MFADVSKDSSASIFRVEVEAKQYANTKHSICSLFGASLAFSSPLKMAAARSFETRVHFHQMTVIFVFNKLSFIATSSFGGSLDHF
jgi:hypothetical protein